MDDSKKRYLRNNIIVLTICFTVCSFLTVSYAYLSSTLDISGNVKLKSPDNMRIIDNAMTGFANGGAENYNPVFGIPTTSHFVSLPNLNSTVTYSVTIKNKLAKNNMITAIAADAFSNSDMEYVVGNLSVGEVINSGVIDKIYTITFKYKDTVTILPANTNLNAIIELSWQEAYVVSYDSQGGNNCAPLTKTVANTLTYGTLCTPTRADYRFDGWYTQPNGGGSLITDASTVSLSTDQTIYAKWIYEQSLLVGNYPSLLSGMIPVVYDSVNHVWQKANMQSAWYNYSSGTGMWANMALVSGTNRATHLAAAAGTTIPLADIVGMYVWIPRYSYAIMGTWGNGGTSSTSPGSITIKFVDTATDETGDVAYPSGLPTVTDWRTHPAFWWDLDNDQTRDASEHEKGFWYAKFEAAPSTTCTAGTTVNAGCDITTRYPLVKPNLVTWTGIRVSTAFTNITTYMTGVNGNTYYGLPTDTSYEVNVPTNSDWGAVAYLTQSIYGKYGNTNFNTIALKEVYNNNSSSRINGRSGGRPGYAAGYTVANGCFDYDGYIRTNNVACNPTGNFSGTVGQYLSGANLYLAYGASTTGTIYGIYDMAGGENEWVMADYYNPTTSPYNYSGTNAAGNTGFNGTYGAGGALTTGRVWPGLRYYDRHTSTTFATACGGVKCYGQAHAEVYSAAGWYADTNGSGLTTSLVTFARGGIYSSVAGSGIFHATRSSGVQTTTIGFRPIIRTLN